MGIITKVEGRRGCGFRKPGGFYLVTENFTGRHCGKLPITEAMSESHPCHCCGLHVHQTRGMQLIPSKIISNAKCRASKCQTPDDPCPLNQVDRKYALMWVGKAYYSAKSFSQELDKLGLSKRLGTNASGLPLLPKGFKLGEDWLCLAHPEASLEVNEEGELTRVPGIFTIIKPEKIQYIVKGSEDPAFLEALEEMGIELIKVIYDMPEGIQADLFAENEEEEE